MTIDVIIFSVVFVFEGRLKAPLAAAAVTIEEIGERLDGNEMATGAERGRRGGDDVGVGRGLLAL